MTVDCIPEWFRTLVRSKHTFLRSIKLLLGYSLIEEMEGLSSYATHPDVHEWAWQVQEQKVRQRNCWLAAIIIGMAVPDDFEKEFWILQQRLLPHADRYMWCSLEGTDCRHEIPKNLDSDVIVSESLHGMVDLFSGQGKLGEAEKMYERALQGKEGALGVEHISTLETVNNLGILFKSQGKLGEAEKMYEQALQGFEKALSIDHISTLDTVNNLGILYFSQGKLGKQRRCSKGRCKDKRRH
jgi:tetratricopeptide (TPR) repeat protein